MCKHPAGLVEGIRGPPAPMVEFLLDASAALIESITGQEYDMEGVHDRGCVWEFFSGAALKPGESIHRDDLNALTPRIGLGGQPGFEYLLGSAWDQVQEPGGPLRSRTGVTSKMTVTSLSSYGVWRHTCSTTPMTRTPSHRVGSLMSAR